MGLSKRATIALGSSTAAVVVVAGVWLVFGGGGTTLTSGQAQPELSITDTTSVPTTTPKTTEAVPTTTAAPTTTVVTTKAKPRVVAPVVPPPAAMPAPVKPPVSIPVPPPPHVAPPPGCTATHSGNPASHANVQSALDAAAGTNYWTGVQNPPLVNQDPSPTNPSPSLGPPAVITVPTALMEAIAWQESGWQSDIQSCDGGNGTMQLQSATATWMNQRFGSSYDYKTLSGNAAIGAEYIEWLIGYFGENSFNYHYDITNPDMLAAVLDAYNSGAASVQFPGGHTVVSHYAATVEALMTQQPWNG